MSTEDSLKAKTRRISISEGSFGVFSNTISDNYMIPFALHLNSNPFQIGILTSFSLLCSPLGQIYGSRRIERKSRKGVLLSGVFGQAIIWPIFFLIAFLFTLKLDQSILPWFLVGFYLLYMFFAGIMTPPWFSLMGDSVPDNSRGRYFAKRNLITSTIALIGTIILSFSLDWFKIQDNLFLGFSIIFLCGFITRLVSVFLFTKHYYPHFDFQISDHTKFIQFAKNIPRSNFGKFTLFVSLLTFGQWIAGPFFSVYMLNDLQFNYSIFIIINLFSSIVALFIFPILGRFSDKFGNVKMLRIGGIIIPILPILWLFFNTPLGIILGPQLLGGIGWTSFNLATSNFIYDNIEPKKRGQYIALYNLLVGIAIILGGLTGSMIITFIPIWFMNKYLFVFLISGIIRIVIVIIILPKIKEVRVHTKPILNLKNLGIPKWLYDITIRNHREEKEKRED
ncbi:MAG: MFS transporter [Candidatus Hodarchaeota archaeon]